MFQELPWLTWTDADLADFDPDESRPSARSVVFLGRWAVWEGDHFCRSRRLELSESQRWLIQIPGKLDHSSHLNTERREGGRTQTIEQ